MKIQTSIYNILLTRLLPIILIGCFFVPISILFYGKWDDVGTKDLLMFLILSIAFVIPCLLTLFSLCKRNKDVLVLTQEGFYCPYLLDAKFFIHWQDVKYVDLAEITSSGGNGLRVVTRYVVIGIDPSIELKKKRTVWDAWNKYFDKHSSHKNLVLSRRTMSNHDLSDIYSLLSLYRNKYLQKPFSVNTKPIREHQRTYHERLNHRKNPAFVYYKTYFSWIYYGAIYSGIFVLSWLVISFFFFSLSIIKALMISALFSLFLMCFIEQNNAIGKFVAKKLRPLAIAFDKDGIYQLNNSHFEYPILWKNVVAVELTRKQRGRYLVPYLFVTIKDQNEKVRTAKIRNDLHDTSVYELYEVMTNYLEAGSNSPS
ncbi:hypothetical protein [Wohlfahrtiimonas populi]|uniref:hypothetical protein n=1 Tax=Wohlfahrtiimonas populi TaxID=1940240 RepID=UPI00098D65F6|nr:hypothetical protein [Wohlfahrtiimonas populi]